MTCLRYVDDSSPSTILLFVGLHGLTVPILPSRTRVCVLPSKIPRGVFDGFWLEENCSGWLHNASVDTPVLFLPVGFSLHTKLCRHGSELCMCTKPIDLTSSKGLRYGHTTLFHFESDGDRC